jgi:uncharacterized repeat protein (TIGR03803 family)
MRLATRLSLLAAASILVTSPAGAAQYRVVYAFQGGSDGAGPNDAMIKLGGLLYGTTDYGGTGTCTGGLLNGCGTVFTLNPATGAETTAYSFQNTTQDGVTPTASLLAVAGTLYGTTSAGGAHYSGTVFAFNPATGTETLVYSFQGGKDGAAPFDSLTYAANALFGVTNYGGSRGRGTVFSLDPSTGAETVLHTFTSDKRGVYPTGGALNIHGKLYGTTYYGGSNECFYGCGTVFSVNAKTGAERVVHAFQGGSDGSNPTANLINVGGTLYGTTDAGGDQACSGNCGTVFALDPSTGTETVLHTFQGGSDGNAPRATLLNAFGMLYGTTYYGGTAQAGTIFAVNLSTGAESMVYSLPGGSEGSAPNGLVEAGGKLFGTTFYGGGSACNNGCGTVFSIKP